MNKQDRITTAILGIALYLLSTGITFGALSLIAKKGSASSLPPIVQDNDGGLQIDPSAPRTEECPINGQMYTKIEREVWDKRRPLAVMIENDVDARPQSGLIKADVVYEGLVEGGITRFMGVFLCDISAKNTKFGPVRSARTPYLPYVLEYDAGYNHSGGAGNCNDDSVDPRAKALCQIDQYKIKDLDQFNLGVKTVDDAGKKILLCPRNPERLSDLLGRRVATEHTLECFSEGLYQVGKVRDGWTNVDAKGIPWTKNFVSWKFKDDAGAGERGSSASAAFALAQGTDGKFGVRWVYDPATNTYKRFMGGEPHTDLETKNQISAKVVILQYAKEVGPVDDHLHVLFENIGSGTATVLQDGQQTKVTWKKPKRTDRTIFYDTKGSEIKLNRGKIWVEMLPIGTPVDFK